MVGVHIQGTGIMLGFRSIADKCGALLLCDMAHISGLVAAQVYVFFFFSFSFT